MKDIMIYFITFLLSLPSCLCSFGYGEEKVLLSSVNALTLYEGKMTRGRRSSPVAQLECIDKGSASCYLLKPKVIQCINRGSDGVDVQWECKCDMDREFKFGQIDVSCEGYDYPDDPYVLKGSCGLRYSLDYTNEHSSPHRSSFSSRIADLIVYVAIGVAIYAFYVTCLSSNSQRQPAYSTTDDDYPTDDRRHGRRNDGGGGYGWFGGNNYQQGYYDDASCGNTRYRHGGRGGGGGGFWTGAATGGLLGYMMGNRWGGGNNYGHGYHQPTYGGATARQSSSSTYTSSGFGGTSRR